MSAEPTVQVPVSLTEQHVRDAIDVAYNEHCGQILLPLTDHEFTAIVHIAAEAVFALLSQPTPSAEVVTTEQAWGEGFEAGATWPQHTPSGIPVDPPINPYESEQAVTATPPRIEDMAPGTTFVDSSGERWTIRQDRDGDPWANSDSGDAWDLDDFDPSTIRDVIPPAVTP